MFGYKSLKIRNFYPDFTNAGFVCGSNTTSPDLVSSLIGTFKSVTRIQDNYFGNPRDVIQISFTREDGEDIYIISKTKSVFTIDLLRKLSNVVGDHNFIELSMFKNKDGFLSPRFRCKRLNYIYQKDNVFINIQSDSLDDKLFHLINGINARLSSSFGNSNTETATAG